MARLRSVAVVLFSLAAVLALVGGCSRSVTWSPDSRAVMVDVDGKLHVFDLTARSFRSVDVGERYAFSPAFSPDRRRLAYYAVTGSGKSAACDIWVRDLASSGSGKLVAAGVLAVRGSAEDLADSKGLLRIAWSPDGERLAYSRVEDDRGRIEILELRSGSVDRLEAKDQSQFMPAWSPGGTHLAFLAQGSSTAGGNSFQVYVTRLGSAEPPRRLGGDDQADFWPGWPLTWSNDGSELAALRLPGNGKADLVLLETEGSGERKLLEIESVQGSITPDFSRVVFVGGPGDHDVLFSAAPFTERKLLDRLPGGDEPVNPLDEPEVPLQPVLSDNGSIVALPFVDGRRDLRLYDLRTGEQSNFWIP